MTDFNSALIFFRSEGPKRPIEVSRLINLICEVTPRDAAISFSRNATPRAFVCAHVTVSEGVRLRASDWRRRISRTGYVVLYLKC